MSAECLELEKTGLVEAFDLQEDEIDEARFNLFGFFQTLQKIERRLIDEGEIEAPRKEQKI